MAGTKQKVKQEAEGPKGKSEGPALFVVALSLIVSACAAVALVFTIQQCGDLSDTKAAFFSILCVAWCVVFGLAIRSVTRKDDPWR